MNERFPTTGSGKGSKARPVNEKKYRENFDIIFKKKEIEFDVEELVESLKQFTKDLKTKNGKKKK